jgi:hypothetical protein
VAVFTFVSASGSPGVSATVLGLATFWGGPVLVLQADPAGGSSMLAGFFRAGLPADTPTVVDLKLAEQEGRLREGLLSAAIRVDGSEVLVVPGSLRHDQTPGLQTLWAPLGSVLPTLGMDVLVDAGRLGLAAWPQPLVSQSDVTVMVFRNTLREVIALEDWARTLRQSVLAGVHEVCLLQVGAKGHYSSRSLEKFLELRVVGQIEFDARRAAVFADGAQGPAARSLPRSLYGRSLRGTGEDLRQLAARKAEEQAQLFTGVREGVDR